MDDLVPAVPGVRATGYLILEATRYVGGRVKEMKLARVTQNPPSLTNNQISIKLNITVPMSVFDRGLALINISVPEELISQPDVTVEAI